MDPDRIACLFGLERSDAFLPRTRLLSDFGRLSSPKPRPILIGCAAKSASAARFFPFQQVLVACCKLAQ